MQVNLMVVMDLKYPNMVVDTTEDVKDWNHIVLVVNVLFTCCHIDSILLWASIHHDSWHDNQYANLVVGSIRLNWKVFDSSNSEALIVLLFERQPSI